MTMRLRDSQIDKTSKSLNNTSAFIFCDVVNNQLNSITKTADYKQLISYLTAIALAENKMTYNNSNSFLMKIIHTLQLTNK